MASTVRKKITNRKTTKSRQIGWREYVGLPDLGIPLIKAKIDTGARTSALCAENIRLTGGSEPKIAFRVPISFCGQTPVDCVAPLLGVREIKNTSGALQERYIIKTLLVIDKRRWHIEVSLANRENMGFDLILGRTALRGHKMLVNPARSFLAGDPVYAKSPRNKTATGARN